MSDENSGRREHDCRDDLVRAERRIGDLEAAGRHLLKAADELATIDRNVSEGDPFTTPTFEQDAKHTEARHEYLRRLEALRQAVGCAEPHRGETLAEIIPDKGGPTS